MLAISLPTSNRHSRVPELLEIEYYRRAAGAGLDREIAKVVADDHHFLKNGTTPEAVKAALGGARFTTARRVGKVLYLDTDHGEVLSLRFGMTGRLIVDDSAVIDRLEYSPRRDEPKWDRFLVRFADGGSMRVQDPRRLGGVELDPDESVLGPDAWDIDASMLTEVIGTSVTAIKTRIMDQSRLAGIGNLLADDGLWRAGIAPTRAANSLSPDEVADLALALHETLRQLFERGGSHMGDTQEERHKDGVCPRDGASLQRTKVGGRTSYWCPIHQV